MAAAARRCSQPKALDPRGDNPTLGAFARTHTSCSIAQLRTDIQQGSTATHNL